MPEFVEAYAIDGLKPAPYNPRRLSEEAFDRLQRSLALFGCVKPVIVNGNGILVAGHQRTKSLKAIGQATAPAILLDGHVSTQDEVQFNLLHNSIETDGSKVKVPASGPDAHGWEWIQPEDVTAVSRSNPAIQAEIRRLVTRYGTWGSVVADSAGRVILNNDYAVVVADLKLPLLCYRLSVQEADELAVWLDGDYGVYDYTQLGIRAYNQHWCQMHRLGGDEGDSNKSTTYEQHVLPALRPGQRVMDFGAGELAYIQRIKAQGWDAHWYEPHVKAAGKQNALDVAATVSHIRDLQRDVPANGLYDVVVLDSVLNSVTSLDFENAVVATCNSLLAKDGTFYTGTRSLGSVERRVSGKKARNNGRYRRSIEFLDENGFTATFRAGVWTMQRFHDPDSLRALMGRYFDEVEIRGNPNGGNIYAVCRKPKALPEGERRAALELEFNMEYPGEYRHNRHRPLVEALMRACKERDDG
ncbi:methyltransferase domain-containing protein [Kitasatospora xanthocidica]|uniref:Methyltransferase domain-containing protein n=1 Tax=Kitasatospora xanthocidica TaxID=83382 RepID=A0A372ZVY3_9ACTN|nr:ParB N-terminal domain-containing protein [Kitasatospora xanthocidica]RGD59477.1 methyltransferase domain-containing protein [Kitasatospora xanthocidica]